MRALLENRAAGSRQFNRVMRPGKRRRVTFIGGFRCNGPTLGRTGPVGLAEREHLRGVVVFADSYEGDGLRKSKAKKVIEYRRDWCTVAIATAGNDVDVIEGTVHRITQDLEFFKPRTEADIESAISSALNTLPDCKDNNATLVIGACPSDNPHATLWGVGNRHLYPANEGWLVRGIGGSVLGFLVDPLYRSDMTLYQGVLLAVHLLRLGIKHVDGVDEPMHVVTLTDEGLLSVEKVSEMAQHEAAFREFDEALSGIFLPFADISVDDFDERLGRFVEKVRALRKAYDPQFVKGYSGFSGSVSPSASISSSVSISVSPSASTSPSASASPSASGSPEDDSEES